MKPFLIICSILLSISCKKEIPCIHIDTKIGTTHRNSLQCHLINSGFLIKSEKELNNFYDSLKCSYSSDFFIPLSFKQTWMIGYSGTAKYMKCETSAELFKDTCNKIIVYNFTFIEDSTSDLFVDNHGMGRKIVEIRYCLISAFPSDYQVMFNKIIKYEKLP